MTIHRPNGNTSYHEAVVQKPSKVAGYLAKAFPLISASHNMAACVCSAVWLTRSMWLGIPLGFILGAALLVLYMSAYDKIAIPLQRRLENNGGKMRVNDRAVSTLIDRSVWDTIWASCR
jgi:hypothetical protein